MKKFLEDVIGPLRIPSHKRYLHYFSGLLSGKIKMNSSPLYLRYVAIESPPSWLNYDGSNNQHHQAEWRSFIKVYEGLNCVFTSGMCYFSTISQIKLSFIAMTMASNDCSGFFCVEFRYSRDSNIDTAIYVRSWPITFAGRCDNTVLSNYTKRSSLSGETRAYIFHSVSHVCHYGENNFVRTWWIGLRLRW